jgi:hypothetical protein
VALCSAARVVGVARRRREKVLEKVERRLHADGGD